MRRRWILAHFRFPFPQLDLVTIISPCMFCHYLVSAEVIDGRSTSDSNVASGTKALSNTAQSKRESLSIRFREIEKLQTRGDPEVIYLLLDVLLQQVISRSDYLHAISTFQISNILIYR
jgi:hypothetical protein